MHAGYSQDRFSSVDGGIAVGNHARTAEVEGPVVDDGSYRQLLEGGGVLEADGPEVLAGIGFGNVDVVAVQGDVAVGIGGEAGQVIAPGCSRGGIASPFADHVESLFALFPFKGDVGNHVPVGKALQGEILAVQRGGHGLGFEPDGNQVAGELGQDAVLEQNAVVYRKFDGAGFAAFGEGDGGRFNGHQPIRSGNIVLSLFRIVRLDEGVVRYDGIGDCHSLDGVVNDHVQYDGFLQGRLDAGLVGFHGLLLDHAGQEGLADFDTGPVEVNQEVTPVLLDLDGSIAGFQQDGNHVGFSVSQLGGHLFGHRP